MKKLHMVTAVTTLGLVLCSAAFAQLYTVSGTVYFDSARTDPAPCSWVQLYSGTGCIHPDSLVDSQVTDANGQYSFDDKMPGSYSVVARWAVVFCTDCDTMGADCGTRFDSDCETVDTGLGDQIVDLDYADINCTCQ